MFTLASVLLLLVMTGMVQVMTDLRHMLMYVCLCCFPRPSPLLKTILPQSLSLHFLMKSIALWYPAYLSLSCFNECFSCSCLHIMCLGVLLIFPLAYLIAIVPLYSSSGRL